MEFKDDEEVDFQVDGLIPNLGCTRTKNSKLLCTMELYWHTKMMVSLGMFPKEEDFLQLKGHMEALETPHLSDFGGDLACST